ncbi:flagellar basal body-associated FliL family protein [Rhodovulum adriaticum]|uniref:Flagellar protein FliL n=1 Tax=Rhodovulum adriaticum TaxID=35804 RepID=A0A4R2P1V5_RHOAD|nr:flagellar basal body-associated FliL family protein [Rhodovulum adriaticum]MBK1634770.1 flagellar basal body-associated protein FliL [Rhodovulum adriaticum]TCP27655.1 flagellar basal body-associated protein FliL [Rhodovulum adriaticum]
MAKFLPLLLALLGLLAGTGAGLALKPAPPADASQGTAVPAGDHAGDAGHNAQAGHANGGSADYVKLSNQFVVPVVHDGRMSALVVMSLSLEVDTGGKQPVFAREPKLRDAFLRVMFDHANTGGFDGAFTETGRMILLRAALLEVARNILGPMVHDVLITDLVRQDA